MTPALYRKTSRLGVKTSELMFAAPLVAAQRMTRLLVAGRVPAARDRREFARMGAEKIDAFGEAWNATAAQVTKSNQQLAVSMMSDWFRTWMNFWFSFGYAPATPQRRVVRAAQRKFQNAAHHAALDMLAKGIAPVHRRAVANARRLGRTKRR